MIPKKSSGDPAPRHKLGEVSRAPNGIFVYHVDACLTLNYRIKLGPTSSVGKPTLKSKSE